MTTEPLVSIITPAFNAERFIEATIESVRLQSYQNWEHLIVVDCNSTDQTLALVKKMMLLEPRIKLLQDPRVSGAAANRNVALEQARGSYIALLDADDLWHSEKLRRQINFMTENKVDFSFTAFARFSEDGLTTGRMQKVPPRLSYADLLKNNSIACLTAVFSAKKFGDLRFQEKGWEDLAFWLQILKRIEFAYSVNEVLAHYRVVRGSRSNNKFFALRMRWQTYREVEHLSLGRSCYLFSHYAISSLLKYWRF